MGKIVRAADRGGWCSASNLWISFDSVLRSAALDPGKDAYFRTWVVELTKDGRGEHGRSELLDRLEVLHSSDFGTSRWRSAAGLAVGTSWRTETAAPAAIPDDGSAAAVRLAYDAADDTRYASGCGASLTLKELLVPYRHDDTDHSVPPNKERRAMRGGSGGSSRRRTRRNISSRGEAGAFGVNVSGGAGDESVNVNAAAFDASFDVLDSYGRHGERPERHSQGRSHQQGRRSPLARHERHGQHESQHRRHTQHTQGRRHSHHHHDQQGQPGQHGQQQTLASPDAIEQLQQERTKRVVDAWERYKELQQRTPLHHSVGASGGRRGGRGGGERSTNAAIEAAINGEMEAMYEQARRKWARANAHRAWVLKSRYFHEWRRRCTRCSRMILFKASRRSSINPLDMRNRLVPQYPDPEPDVDWRGATQLEQHGGGALSVPPTHLFRSVLHWATRTTRTVFDAWARAVHVMEDHPLRLSLGELALHRGHALFIQTCLALLTTDAGNNKSTGGGCGCHQAGVECWHETGRTDGGTGGTSNRRWNSSLAEGGKHRLLHALDLLSCDIQRSVVWAWRRIVHHRIRARHLSAECNDRLLRRRGTRAMRVWKTWSAQRVQEQRCTNHVSDRMARRLLSGCLSSWRCLNRVHAILHATTRVRSRMLKLNAVDSLRVHCHMRAMTAMVEWRYLSRWAMSKWHFFATRAATVRHALEITSQRRQTKMLKFALRAWHTTAMHAASACRFYARCQYRRSIGVWRKASTNARRSRKHVEAAAAVWRWNAMTAAIGTWHSRAARIVQRRFNGDVAESFRATTLASRHLNRWRLRVAGWVARQTAVDKAVQHHTDGSIIRAIQWWANYSSQHAVCRVRLRDALTHRRVVVLRSSTRAWATLSQLRRWRNTQLRAGVRRHSALRCRAVFSAWKDYIDWFRFCEQQVLIGMENHRRIQRRSMLWTWQSRALSWAAHRASLAQGSRHYATAWRRRTLRVWSNWSGASIDARAQLERCDGHWVAAARRTALKSWDHFAIDSKKHLADIARQTKLCRMHMMLRAWRREWLRSRTVREFRTRKGLEHRHVVWRVWNALVGDSRGLQERADKQNRQHVLRSAQRCLAGFRGHARGQAAKRANCNSADALSRHHILVRVYRRWRRTFEVLRKGKQLLSMTALGYARRALGAWAAALEARKAHKDRLAEMKRTRQLTMCRSVLQKWQRRSAYERRFADAERQVQHNRVTRCLRSFTARWQQAWSVRNSAYSNGRRLARERSASLARKCCETWRGYVLSRRDIRAVLGRGIMHLTELVFRDRFNQWLSFTADAAGRAWRSDVATSLGRRAILRKSLTRVRSLVAIGHAKVRALECAGLHADGQTKARIFRRWAQWRESRQRAHASDAALVSDVHVLLALQRKRHVVTCWQSALARRRSYHEMQRHNYQSLLMRRVASCFVAWCHMIWLAQTQAAAGDAVRRRRRAASVAQWHRWCLSHVALREKRNCEAQRAIEHQRVRSLALGLLRWHRWADEKRRCHRQAAKAGGQWRVHMMARTIAEWRGYVQFRQYKAVRREMAAQMYRLRTTTAVIKSWRVEVAVTHNIHGIDRGLLQRTTRHWRGVVRVRRLGDRAVVRRIVKDLWHPWAKRHVRNRVVALDMSIRISTHRAILAKRTFLVAIRGRVRAAQSLAVGAKFWTVRSQRITIRFWSSQCHRTRLRCVAAQTLSTTVLQGRQRQALAIWTAALATRMKFKRCVADSRRRLSSTLARTCLAAWVDWTAVQRRRTQGHLHWCQRSACEAIGVWAAFVQRRQRYQKHRAVGAQIAHCGATRTRARVIASWRYALSEARSNKATADAYRQNAVHSTYRAVLSAWSNRTHARRQQQHGEAHCVARRKAVALARWSMIAQRRLLDRELTEEVQHRRQWATKQRLWTLWRDRVERYMILSTRHRRRVVQACFARWYKRARRGKERALEDAVFGIAATRSAVGAEGLHAVVTCWWYVRERRSFRLLYKYAIGRASARSRRWRAITHYAYRVARSAWDVWAEQRKAGKLRRMAEVHHRRTTLARVTQAWICSAGGQQHVRWQKHLAAVQWQVGLAERSWDAWVDYATDCRIRHELVTLSLRCIVVATERRLWAEGWRRWVDTIRRLETMRWAGIIKRADTLWEIVGMRKLRSCFLLWDAEVNNIGLIRSKELAAVAAVRRCKQRAALHRWATHCQATEAMRRAFVVVATQASVWSLRRHVGRWRDVHNMRRAVRHQDLVLRRSAVACLRKAAVQSTKMWLCACLYDAEQKKKAARRHFEIWADAAHSDASVRR